MAKAPPEEQLRLLDLQAVYGKLRSLSTQETELKEDPSLIQATQELEAAQRSLNQIGVQRQDAESAVNHAEDAVQQVVARIERDEKRLQAGGLSKDLMALQKELERLAKRRGELEETELEAMELAERINTEYTEQEKNVTTAQQHLDQVAAENHKQREAIAVEKREAQSQRDTLSQSFDTALLELYQRTLEKRGVGAARLFHGRSEGSGMQLSPGDLAEINAAAEDEIVFCPDSGCILVRSPEWS